MKLYKRMYIILALHRYKHYESIIKPLEIGEKKQADIFGTQI